MFVGKTSEKNINAEAMLAALGGKANIKRAEACLTRLRVTLHDNHLLDKSALKTLGAVDVIKVGEMFQIILGTSAGQYRDEINALLSA